MTQFGLLRTVKSSIRVKDVVVGLNVRCRHSTKRQCNLSHRTRLWNTKLLLEYESDPYRGANLSSTLHHKGRTLVKLVYQWLILFIRKTSGISLVRVINYSGEGYSKVSTVKQATSTSLQIVKFLIISQSYSKLCCRSMQLKLFLRNIKFGKISGSHGGEYEDECLPVYCAVQSRGNWQTFQRFLRLHCPDDGGRKRLWNVGKFLQNYMVQDTRRQ
jgi:hypothetical protein